MQEVAQGRTWYGSTALEKGLVDRLGGFPAAIALAKEKASLPAGAPVKVELFERDTNFLKQLLNRGEDDEEGGGLGDAVLRRLLAESGLQKVAARVPGMLPFTRQVLAGETLFPMSELAVEYR